MMHMLTRLFRRPEAVQPVDPEIEMIMQELDEELEREVGLLDEGLGLRSNNVADLLRGFAARCKRLQVVGSLRRGKAEPGDVDILYIPKSNLQVIEWLEQIADDESKIKAKDGGVWTCTVRGVSVDFIPSSEKDWGMDLIIYTGSRWFGEKVKRHAERRGIPILKDSRGHNRVGLQWHSDGYSGYSVDQFSGWSEQRILTHLGLESYMQPYKREEPTDAAAQHERVVEESRDSVRLPSYQN